MMNSVKTSLLICVGVCLSFFLIACPVGLDYAPGNPGTEKIDKKLLGTWNSGSNESEVKSVKIEKGASKNSLKVTVLERGEMYALETDNLTGYCTKIANQKFLYLKPENESKYYLYQYQLSGKMLLTHDVGLLHGGIDAVTSTEAYRQQIVESLKSNKDSCLTSPIWWSKGKGSKSIVP